MAVDWQRLTPYMLRCRTAGRSTAWLAEAVELLEAHDRMRAAIIADVRRLVRERPAVATLGDLRIEVGRHARQNETAESRVEAERERVADFLARWGDVCHPIRMMLDDCDTLLADIRRDAGKVTNAGQTLREAAADDEAGEEWKKRGAAEDAPPDTPDQE